MNPLKKDDNAIPIQAITFGGASITADGTSASAATAVVNADDDQLVLITVSADSYLVFGANPTATSAGMRVWAKQTIAGTVLKGHKVAVLGGIVTVTKHNG